MIGWWQWVLAHTTLAPTSRTVAIGLLSWVWVDGVPTLARVRPGDLVAGGWSTSYVRARRALRELELRGITEHPHADDLNLIRMHPPEAWTPAPELDELRRGWDAMTRPGSAWGGATDLVAHLRTALAQVPLDLLPRPQRPTWHPTDRPSVAWVRRLARMDGPNQDLPLALRAMAKEPETVAPISPSAFAREVWSLTIRGRRIFGAALLSERRER